MTDRKTPKLRRSLRRTFGLERLRPGQAEVIESVLDGHDTLALMPTGAGKSLCYQLPALHLAGTTIIVSPVISLMKDQVDKLQELGLDALQVNSSLTRRGESEAIRSIEEERSDFVFTTRERLTNPEFLATLRRTTIDFVVIDEALVSRNGGMTSALPTWRCGRLSRSSAIRRCSRSRPPRPTRSWRTSVGSSAAGACGLYTTGIYRPNLHFAVVHVSGDEEKQAALLRMLEEGESSGIVYAATVRHVDTLAPLLELRGADVFKYHGRLAAKERREAQELHGGRRGSYRRHQCVRQGIDKPDIRLAIHYDLPGTIEAYYQEAGRAGLRAQCTLPLAGAPRLLRRGDARTVCDGCHNCRKGLAREADRPQ